MTDRLYYRDAYLREFDAPILEQADGGTRVFLARTAFYPTSGGQPHDIGTLGDVRVLDVIDEDDRIAHILTEPLGDLGPAATVHGAIAWSRRFDHMQQHTGQHLLSAVFESLYHARTSSVHFGPTHASLDLDIESLSHDRLVRAEERANEIIGENRPVTVGFEAADAATGLRKESARTGTLRIVTIEGVDRSACGGTHVSATGAIGAIALRSVERIRESLRIEFLCGARVVRQARADFTALGAIAASMSAAPADVPRLVAAQGEELKRTERERRALERDLAGFNARALFESTVPDETGLRLVDAWATPITGDGVRALVQALIPLGRVGVLASAVGEAGVFVAASEDSGLDACRILKSALSRVEGRGGGSPRLAQGTAPLERHPELHGILAELLANRS